MNVLVHFATPSDRSLFEGAFGRIPSTKVVWIPRPPEATFGAPPFFPGPVMRGTTHVPRDRIGLFGDHDDFHDVWNEWGGMPELSQEDLAPYDSVLARFVDDAAVGLFEARLGERIERGARRTPSVWYPKRAIGRMSDKRYRADPPLSPEYPVYIVSKGRPSYPGTSRVLSALGVRHFVVVEEAERDAYEAAKRSLATILVLDPAYQRGYETLDDRTDLGPGPGPARNFAWNHSVGLGARRHWVMDDNIKTFHRLNRNLKTLVADGTIFRVMEVFSDRYSNVAMSGPNYFMFAERKAVVAPFVRNTRIYSCNLIRNDLAFRWRGRFNEDTILSLDLLKAGYATVQFNAFLQWKATTQTVGGGNTAEFYAKLGTTAKSAMLVETHPDVARATKRFHDANGEPRDHHIVDYSVFRTPLVRGEGVFEGVDDFGMVLERIDPETGAWVSMTTPWYPWEDGR